MEHWYYHRQKNILVYCGDNVKPDLIDGFSYVDPATESSLQILNNASLLELK